MRGERRPPSVRGGIFVGGQGRSGGCEANWGFWVGLSRRGSLAVGWSFGERERGGGG